MSIISANCPAQKQRRPKTVEPAAIGVDFEGIPVDLIAKSPWVPWRFSWRSGRRCKIPIHSVTGEPVDVTNPDNWTDFDTAARAVRAGNADAVGVVLTPSDYLVVIDIDGCIDAATGHIEPWVERLIRYADSFAEVSVSGKGIHIFCRGKLPSPGSRSGRIEVYSANQYIAITGMQIAGAPSSVFHRQGWLDGLWRDHFGSRPSRSTRLAVSDRRRVAETAAPDPQDEELLAKALASSRKLDLLWKGNWAQAGEFPSQSEAELSLAARLCRLVGPDESRIDRLFRQSGLMRPKWDERRGSESETYGSKTIAKAIASSFAKTERYQIAKTENQTAKTESPNPGPVLPSVSGYSKTRPVFEASEVLNLMRLDSAPKDTKREVFALARRLKATKELAGKPHGAHKAWVRRWFEENNWHLRGLVWSDAWALYMLSYGSVRSVGLI